jgi:Tc5 transposase-like DNA-binding protein
MGRRRRPLRPEEKADSKRKRPLEETQELLQNACDFHHSQQTLPSGDRLSIRKTALKYKVSYFTLRNRIKGLHQSARKAHEFQQSLSTVQERVVVEWLNELSNQSVPLSKRTLRKKVQEITGGRIKPGKQWITRFLARHPGLKLGKPSGLDPKRAQCFNKTTVTNHFQLLEKVLHVNSQTFNILCESCRDAKSTSACQMPLSASHISAIKSVTFA